MTRNPIQIVTLTAALGLLGVFAMGQTQTTSPPDIGAGQGYKSADDSTVKPGKHADGMREHMKGMMENMPDDTKMRCQMQMNMVVSPSDPSAILALKDQLLLTTDQTTELDAIIKEARTQAVAVLNADQQTMLNTLPQTPHTMKVLHEKMISQMQPMRTTTPSNKPMDCPVMQMMRDQASSTTLPISGSPSMAPTDKTAIEPKTATDVLDSGDANTAKAATLLSQLEQYTTDNKIDLAEKTLNQLDGMEGLLPASLQSQIETARTALKAKQAAATMY